MTQEHIILSLLIAVFSIVQSIFGMGILVFGTPTLLLMGYDFITTLTLLIPASLAISFFQIINFKFDLPVISKNLYFISMPCIGIGLYIADSLKVGNFIIILISFMLVISASIKLDLIKIIIDKKKQSNFSVAYHTVLGLIHGLTNLGGALLPILTIKNSLNKNTTRYIIAHYYLFFTSTQLLLILILLEDYNKLLNNLYTMVIAIIIYFIVGNRIFEFTNFKVYNIMFSIFMYVYAIVLMLKYIFLK